MQRIVTGAFLIGIVVLIAILTTLLNQSLKKTIYAYKNIEMMAGIIFLDIFAILFLVEEIHGNRIGWGYDYKAILLRIAQFPRTFSYFAIFVFLIISVLLCISNLSLIRHEGFRPRNMQGIVVGVVFVGGTLLLYHLSDTAFEKLFMQKNIFDERTGLLLYTIVPLFFLVLLCYLECVFMGCALMGWIAAKQKPRYDKDFIIIPGCKISKEGGLLPLLKGRTNRAIRYAWDQEIACGRRVRYVPSGGKGEDEIMSEASAMELYLLSHGAEDYEVFPERESKNTYQNFAYSIRKVQGIMPNAKIAFATTNYHMLRCGIIAHEQGMDLEGIASKTKWYFWPNGFVREVIAILFMHRKHHICMVAIALVLCVLLGIAIVLL